ncbi:ArsR/SmtB family transcription factor [Pararhizobium mangrovi]|uniref:Metalloregulator ArsR/SmtB family transcription factor n=1 Tax=Pararhizobium mangrovi TaxID=2590452 RepID=A0A506U5D2_9HYPH|nr:metalloregulator ArsR/SmtB family transcription factor [Pararhizobium mangrovi]TPW27137.1 metalloregulator ArsR/SmtB family transcription factor [Pararhizobium mangrovi]
MLDPVRLDLDTLVDVLKAAGEPTRMRLVALLADGDLTVTDLTAILGQSQPRISRHLKLLMEAGLIERYQEGAWAYFRLTGEGGESALVRTLIAASDTQDAVLARDAERLSGVKRARAERAQAYFARNAESWDELRSLHVPEERVEAKLVELVGSKPIDSMLDLGTGTGRILQLFQGIYRRGYGVDASRNMLSVARANLDEARIMHASVRHGDLFNPPLERNRYDLVTVHQVLHFVQDAGSAIAEAARMLAPAGRLAIVDFAPHDLEYLRSDHAHQRLGFSHETVSDWLEEADLEVESVIDLPPDTASERSLTVTIWLARDRRLLVAEGDDSATQRGAA